MTINSIDTISRALAATLSNKDYTNMNTTILASEVASIMADNLARMVTQRTFPNTEQINSAVQGVISLIQKCLYILQTILTPNMPQDPTVDVMRNYLEYMKIFTSGGTAAFSLQEQTFLVQKQLQKYFVQKVLKSKASQTALPYLTLALRKLMDYLAQLIQMGDEQLVLEDEEYVFISVEKRSVKAVAGTQLKRPRVNVDLTGLTTTHGLVKCNASQVTFKTIIFKKNPYFWGEFADRITSYVPVLQIDGAVLPNARVTYSFQNKVEAACNDKTPTYKEDNLDKIIYMVFDRQHAADDILFFIRPNTTGLKYDVYLRIAEKPNLKEKKFDYHTAMKTDHWTNEDGYKLLIKSSEFAGTGKIWIALKPLLEQGSDDTLLKSKFCANVTSVSCLEWIQKKAVWDKDKCRVSPTCTRSVTVCDCDNRMLASGEPMTVGTTSYVPLSEIDFDNKVVDELSIGRGPVIGVIIVLGSLYVLFALWAWREDQKDKYKWSYSLLIDNDIADNAFYIVSVYTGLRSASGTNSKVGFILVGEDGETDIRRLDDDSHVGFERGSVRTFVMSTRRYLGELICLRIWHDDSGGNNSSWFLNKVVVTDLADRARYIFVCNRWFDYDTGDKKVDRLLTATSHHRSFTEFISYTVAEQHLWFSVFLRPIRSNFTRVQRLSCLLGMMCITMIVSTMVIRTPNENTRINEVKIGPFRFSLENVQAALISLAVGTVVVTIASFFFTNAENNENKRHRSWVLDNYRKANARFKFDPSIVGREFAPPAEDALQYNYIFLPHVCIYVGWTILVMSVVVASSLIVLYSESWKLMKSEDWMTSFFISCLCSMFVTEVIKVVCFMLVYAMMCPRAYEPPDPEIDIDSLEEITKRNSATLNIGPHFQGVLPLPKIPDEKTLMNNQINRIRNHQLIKILFQLVVYSGLLYIVYKISYESRDPRSFYLKNHVSEMFTFKTVTDLKSYTTWLDEQFINNYFSKTYYGASPDTETRPYTEDLVNFRVGPARLRQLRITPEPCIGPLATKTVCHNRFVEKKKQTHDFCKGWVLLPCPETEKSTSLTSTAWLYKSSDEVWGFTTIADYNSYGGGGYFMKLDVNSDVSKKIFRELKENNWFDNMTRAVILEFSLFNANANLFVYAKFVAEFPEMGGFLPYSTVSVFRLFLHSGPDGDFIMILELVFVLIMFFATLGIAYQIFTDPKTFIKSIWNILDILALIMSYVSTTMFVIKLGIITKTIKVFREDKNEYIGFENLEFYDYFTNATFGILVFILSVRISRILGYSGKINEMAAVICNAADDLLGFLCIFSIATLGYVICGTMLFGRDEGRFKTVYESFGTITETFIGKNKVTDIIKSQPIYAEIYYATFLLLVLMTLITIAAAILNFSIADVREETAKLAPTNIMELIWDRIVVLAGKLQAPKKAKKASVVRRDSESELREILADLHLFIRNLKKANRYRLTDHEEEMPVVHTQNNSVQLVSKSLKTPLILHHDTDINNCILNRIVIRLKLPLVLVKTSDMDVNDEDEFVFACLFAALIKSLRCKELKEAQKSGKKTKKEAKVPVDSSMAIES
ncbi:hypothetical protein DPMN_025184 [Dreissena polymorpha]|uniref:PLAT domain-containing protein n=1 Tax=Dreissena polymorpha TaxID=45954 RepID=A0A9D4LR54_DREPO|nr:hypothetical protein DPMN_025184 [Dreissena polymorpha]